MLNCSAISPVRSQALQSLMRQQYSVYIQMRVYFHASSISAQSESGEATEDQPGKLSEMIPSWEVRLSCCHFQEMLQSRLKQYLMVLLNVNACKMQV